MTLFPLTHPTRGFWTGALALTVASLAPVGAAHAHGYVVNSRAKLCADRVNENCGPIIYEPQSVEGPDRFPETGPADGEIASAAFGTWAPLNEQSPTRWTKTPFQSGFYTFEWRKTAPHVTLDWRYFITKEDWDPTQPLARSAFDLNPFCVYSGNLQQPDSNVFHDCFIPEREGYHIILAVWDVGDTPASFYNVIDAQFDGSNQGPSFEDIGDINPSRALESGDVALVRFFDAGGELLNRETAITINSASEGAAATWPRLLAQAVTNQGDGEVVAGVRGTDGEIVPRDGRNDIFARSTSSIIRAEIAIDEAEPADFIVLAELDQTVLQPNDDGGIAIEIGVSLNRPGVVRVEAFMENRSIAQTERAVSAADTIVLPATVAGGGDFVVVVNAVSGDGTSAPQVTLNGRIETGDIGEVMSYPDGLGGYAAGAQVRGYDGGVYECLVAPWCNGDRSYYAPSLGLAWDSAWRRIADGEPVAPPPPGVVYPEGHGGYQAGDVVEGADGGIYRCLIPGWCNSGAAAFYAPGSGSAWESAWTRISG